MDLPKEILHDLGAGTFVSADRIKVPFNQKVVDRYRRIWQCDDIFVYSLTRYRNCATDRSKMKYCEIDHVSSGRKVVTGYFAREAREDAEAVIERLKQFSLVLFPEGKRHITLPGVGGCVYEPERKDVNYA